MHKLIVNWPLSECKMYAMSLQNCAIAIFKILKFIAYYLEYMLHIETKLVSIKISYHTLLLCHQMTFIRIHYGIQLWFGNSCGFLFDAIEWIKTGMVHVSIRAHTDNSNGKLVGFKYPRRTFTLEELTFSGVHEIWVIFSIYSVEYFNTFKNYVQRFRVGWRKRKLKFQKVLPLTAWK